MVRGEYTVDAIPYGELYAAFLFRLRQAAEGGGEMEKILDIGGIHALSDSLKEAAGRISGQPEKYGRTDFQKWEI